MEPKTCLKLLEVLRRPREINAMTIGFCGNVLLRRLLLRFDDNFLNHHYLMHSENAVGLIILWASEGDFSLRKGLKNLECVSRHV